MCVRLKRVKLLVFLGQKALECQQLHMALFNKLFEESSSVRSLAATDRSPFPSSSLVLCPPSRDTHLALVNSFFWYLQNKAFL